MSHFIVCSVYSKATNWLPNTTHACWASLMVSPVKRLSIEKSSMPYASIHLSTWEQAWTKSHLNSNCILFLFQITFFGKVFEHQWLTRCACFQNFRQRIGRVRLYPADHIVPRVSQVGNGPTSLLGHLVSKHTYEQKTFCFSYFFASCWSRLFLSSHFSLHACQQTERLFVLPLAFFYSFIEKKTHACTHPKSDEVNKVLHHLVNKTFIHEANSVDSHQNRVEALKRTELDEIERDTDEIEVLINKLSQKFFVVIPDLGELKINILQINIVHIDLYSNSKCS